MGGIEVSYSQLGLLASLFFLSSGLCQTLAGFVVDKIGPGPVLIVRLGLLSAAVFLYTVAPSYGSSNRNCHWKIMSGKLPKSL